MTAALPTQPSVVRRDEAGFFTRLLLGSNSLYQRLVRRGAIGAAPYWLSIFLISFAVYRGLCDAPKGWFLCSGMLFTVVFFHIALRSGWSQRFKDPSLALAGVLVGMSWAALAYMLSGAIHGAQLLILVLVMGLAVFNLNAALVRMTCMYALVSMSAAIVSMALVAPAQYPPAVGYFHLAILWICLPSMLAVGMQRIKLTKKLKRQKVDLANALAQLKEIAIRDELTGLYNRGHMIELLQHAVERQLRTGERFSFVMFDLDFFKKVNDTHGHGVGDDVLRSFASVATTVLRKSDILARWGGEEFVAICAHSDDPDAGVGVERLLRQWSQTEVSSQAPDLRVSFSAGITAYQSDEAVDAALARADKALYEAKAKGRNCIVRL